jgi:hypothetical protein
MLCTFYCAWYFGVVISAPEPMGVYRTADEQHKRRQQLVDA